MTAHPSLAGLPTLAPADVVAGPGPWELLTRANDRAFENAAQVGALLGHMKNAVIDLQAGESKATAIRTLQGGIDMIEKHWAERRALILGEGK